MIPITIGARPDNDFRNPLGLLSDCHRRIERYINQIILISETAARGSLCRDQREALGAALRYFRQASPLHTADEEVSLFPRMRETGNPDALAAIEALEADHRDAEVWHHQLDEIGLRWIEEDGLDPASAEDMDRLLGRLNDLYHGHIAMEDNRIFPLAGETLDPDMIQLVGREMAERRGLNPDALPDLPRCTIRRMEREVGSTR